MSMSLLQCILVFASVACILAPTAQAQACNITCATPGQYFQDCGTGCVNCPTGFYCPPNIRNPIACPVGTVRATVGASAPASCVACASGSIAPNTGTTACTACATNFITNSSKTACIACPAGQWDITPNRDTCSAVCASGFYGNRTTRTCLACSPGYICPSKSMDFETACPAGQFANSGAVGCLPCYAGRACGVAASNLTMTVCQLGSYSLAGSSVCTRCPPNYYCPTTTAAPLGPCPLGFYSIGNQTACITCPAGSYCDGTASSGYPAPCPIGTFASPGASVCSVCPAGYACTNTTTAQLCPAGYYSPSGQTICSACPSGSYCPNATMAIACPRGSYSNGSTGTCAVCSSGYYANKTGSSSCTQCPAESYCPSSASDPIACAKGFTSPGGSLSCNACPAGTTWNRRCTPCPPGFYCLTAAMDPVPCAAGSYSPGNLSSCIICPVGAACVAQSTLPQFCVSGYYSLGGQGACTQCPVDYQCTIMGNLTYCDVAKGYYSPLGDAACHLCPAGRTCLTASGANTSNVCAPGTYRIANTPTCVVCPPGYMCPYPQYGPMRCPKGAYSGQGSLACTMCPPGYACNNRTQPMACLLGSYSNGGDEVCTDCPAGWACQSPMASPKPCLLGTYSVIGSTNCTACPRGFACPNTMHPTVNRCPNGTFATGSAAVCTVCPAGFYCPTTEFAIQIPCNPGSYSYEGQYNCTVCPASWACPNRNALTQPPLKCLHGSFSLGGSTQCTVCPAGYECPYDDQNFMRPCKNGTFSEPSQRSCSNCTVGYYCPLTAVSATQPYYGVFGVGRQVVCPPGSYSNANQQECTRCPQGYYCTSTAGPTGNAVACAIGRLTTRLGQYVDTGATECSDCPAGSSCSAAGVSSSTCTPGTYSSGSVCTTCQAGYECPTTNQDPNPCPAGTYSLNGYTSCRPCAAGYICGVMSTTSTPVAGLCPIGYYCTSGATSATLCPAGTYGRAAGGTSLDQACADCDAGSTCPAGTAGKAAQLSCPVGNYCPPGSAFPTPCPSGTYSLSVNAQTRATCLLCPEGVFCPAGTSDYTQNPCPPGFYCPAGSGTGFENGCPVGTYSPQFNLTSVTQCFVCPQGSYCPSVGISAPVPCTPGTYQSQSGSSSCTPCEEGWACQGTGQTSSHITPCAQGHYCPRGTSTYDANPCPGGSYTYRTNLASHTQCEACWKGYSCPPGTGLSPIPDPVICPMGFYCPGAPTPVNGERTFISQYAGTVTSQPKQFMCPQGSFSPATGIWDVEQCVPCPAGRWCPGGGSGNGQPCSAGYYCPTGSYKATQIPCAAGTYGATTGLTSQADCKDCISGSYCQLAATAQIQCPAGTYSPFNKTVGRGPSTDVTDRQCLQCPAGYYCPLGSVKALPCAVGTYSAAQAWICTVCEAGRYCPIVATTRAKKDSVYQCPAGLYCPAGMNRMPSIDYDPCPAGSYCPLGAVAPVQCFPGTYNPKTGRPSIMDCIECAAGYYCSTNGATNVTGVCSPGYYCPIGSSSTTQEPCPARYYRSTSGGETAEFCSVCTRGSYCPEGSVNPTACPQGYYCLDGTDIPEPCPIGTFGNRTGLRARSECSSCTSGYYCDGLGLSHPTGLCDPGYYCIGRAFASAPPGLPTGGLCPKGGYCPPGSSLPTACAEGTFNNNTGGSTQQDCVTCTPGYYCAGSNLPFPSGPCAAGYYCTGGASTPTQFRTPAGHYTLSGAAAASECALGTYNPLPGQGACTACVVGNYCPTRALVNYIICYPGGYCPAASVTPRSCPAGTFQPYTGRQNITNCVACSPGYYCQADNLTSPTAQCSSGFYCKRYCITTTCGRYLQNYVATENAAANNGIENNMGGTCPYGKYCPGGTSYPFSCPIGSVRNAIQGVSVNDCSACPSRYYCPSVGMSTLISSNKPLQCDAGFYCPGAIADGSNIGCSDPTCANHTGEACTKSYVDCSGVNSFLIGEGARRCPHGYYCPIGSDQPTLCFLTSLGKTTYQDEYQQSTCKMCPSGYWCDPSILASVKQPQLCPIGRYCPAGTSATQPMCPEGTWSNVTMLQNFSQCAQCPPRRYCPTRGLKEINDIVTPLCSAGYFCTAGAKNTFAVAGTMSGIGGICPPGFYCPNGTATNISYPCPPGTYKSTWFGSTVRACIDCTGGFYCAGSSNVKTTSICRDGYYCPTACSDDMCLNVTYSALPFPGGPCPVGYFCKGTGTVGPILPQQCPEGTYQNETAQSTCKTCPPGFFCGPNTVQPYACGAGNYCPNGTKSSAIPRCPPGTKSDYMFAQNISECILCTNGRYCPDYAMNASGPLCAAGYYCTEGAATSTGGLGVRGGITGACPRGYYCPIGTSYATEYPCPIGTFLAYTTSRNISACTPCSPGMHCNTTGLASVSGPCYPGYYCPRRCEDLYCSNIPCSGSCSGTPGGACPMGNYCPQRIVAGRTEGAYEPTLCNAGTYAPSTGYAACLTCPAGSYCPQGSSVPQTCPTGYYCPNGTLTATQFACPAGTFQPNFNATSINDCLLCSPGMYCEGTGLSAPTAPCFATFYCTSGAATPSALTGPRGGITGTCPSGFYCPNATQFDHQYPCPAGTYQPFTGTSNVSACLSCTPGFYCPNVNQSAAVDKCPSGYFCPRGCNDSACSNMQCNSQCSAANITRGGACPAGYICPQDSDRGSIYPTSCPAGTYSPGEARSTCLPCPSGFYCDVATSVPSPCPRGRYCPNSTNTSIPSCPAGTYNALRNGSSIADCTPCSAGKYCAQVGNDTFTDNCFGGYYCESGAVTGRGEVGVMGGVGGICPAGYYCPPGTQYRRQFACPSGTYNPRTGASTAVDCIPCTPGFYCLNTGMRNVTGRCTIGFFCPLGCIDSTCATQYNPNVTGGPCPTGRYCPLVEMTSPIMTQANGNTYIRGSITPLVCPAGYFAPNNGSSNCTICPAGYYCAAGEPSRLCTAGHYCPAGTGENAPSCPPGSYSNATGLNSSQYCTRCSAGRECPTYGMVAPGGPCARGYFCLGGALNPFGLVGDLGGFVSGFPTDALGRSVCPVGRYCPTGSVSPLRCPAGTYNPVTGGWNITQSCLPCDGGKYCAVPGLNSPNGTCMAGFYCPRGCVDKRCFSRVSQNLGGGVCPAGFYCPEGSATYLPCPEGTTTTSQGASSCPMCPPMYYCPGGGTALECPTGHYCPGNTSSAIPACPNGTYSNLTKRSSPTDCQLCLPSYACTVRGLVNPDALCVGGYFCQSGAASVTGILGVTGGLAGVCPAGYFCPNGTASPSPCPKGTYLNTTGAIDVSECLLCTPGSYCATAHATSPTGPCDAGFYCPSNQTTGNPFEYVCPTGAFCPKGSVVPRICPAGSFNSLQQQTNLTGCLACPLGKYCVAGETNQGTADCPSGWYCSGGTNSSHPKTNGGYCTPGFYCPAGSSFKIACDPGYACEGNLLSQPSITCSAGYYCATQAEVPTPTDGISGNYCPAGAYCPSNSSHPLDCPPGTYNSVTHQSTNMSCTPCTPGYYCPNSRTTAATLLCSVGYYCPLGQSVGAPGDHVCPEGFYCPAGSPAPRRCPIGTYQDQAGKGFCKSCPSGYFCNPKNLCNGTNTSTPQACPFGYFCPNGTRYAEEHPCPIGTYNDAEGVTSEAGCRLCDAGKFCSTPHMSSPGPNCTAGYICVNGSSVSTPNDNIMGYICPPGQYCPSGATSPTACPKGTFSNATGLRSDSECSLCTVGKYCSVAGMISPTGDCAAGFYCPAGQSVANPSPYQCPYGQICTIGSSTWSFVPSGSYVSTVGASVYQACPAGSYCDALRPCNNCTAVSPCTGNYTCPRTCPAGYYCPPGTEVGTQFACPYGTFGANTGLQTAAQCANCTGGHFCPLTGMTSNTLMTCQAGYICLTRSMVANPTDGVQGYKCPAGSYCPAGALQPTKCNQGTFNPSMGTTNKSACIPCKVGHACTTTGLPNPDATCAAGYYCPGGLSSATNPQYLCPQGYYCPLGVSNPIRCSVGTWAPTRGMALCDACPAGYYCNANETCPGTNVTSPKLCYAGHYCPSGTGFGDQFPCPRGTFSTRLGVTNASACALCPTGYACPNFGMFEPLPECLPGYYCRLGAMVRNPTDGNATGDVCPRGYYCPAKTGTPIGCPIGTFSNSTGLVNSSQCSNCTPGYYCGTTGLSGPIGKCNGGYYCGVGEYASNPPDKICPTGKYCPSGATSPLDCPNGTFVLDGLIGQATCATCPRGYYCNLVQQLANGPNASVPFVVPQRCPAGYYCLDGTQYKSQYPCLPGTYSNIDLLSAASECKACDPGLYCALPGLSEPSGRCLAGYYCRGGSNTSTPALPMPTTIGGLCPSGYYCPLGSIEGIACPVGTYYGGVGARNVSACLKCRAGYYCPNQATIIPTGAGQCTAGYYCPGGNSAAATPSLICPKGHYCPTGSAAPVPCLGGSFSGAIGAVTCQGCPEYYFCPRGTIDPILCYTKHVCAANSSYPAICVNGTYAQTSVAMKAQSECVLCPAGVYCSNGTISGPCAAGYLCEYGNSIPAPSTSTDVLNVKKGGLCPLGHYCPMGTTSKLPCTNQTVGYTLGLEAATDCSPCRAGYYCLETSVIPIDCPPGYYCPGYVGKSIGLIACPIGTYNAKYFASDISYCLPCQAGYYCPIEAMASTSVYPVPVGFYSSTGQTTPYPCPGGTYQPKSNGSAAWPSACLRCPVGYYCGPQASTWNQTCPEGAYCPPGSTYPQHCPGATYCPRNTYAPVDCPAGYYCPPLSPSPILCWNGTYCPPKTESPYMCPNGYISRNDTTARYEMEDSCQICPPGTFSTNTLYCEPCTAGYICLGGTTVARPTDIATERGYICPIGYYCPSGSSTPSACPPGTYNNGTGGRTINACSDCQIGYYQPDYAQSTCIRCGKSATSSPGSAGCDCLGKYRSFQPGDGSCRCIPGYVFYTEGQRLSEDDSSLSCQPKIYQRCTPSTYRSSKGNCVHADSSQICSFCPNSSGVVDPQIGVCKCDSIQTYEETCDEACIKESSTITLDASSNTLVHYDPKTGQTKTIDLDSSGILGTRNCASGASSCDVKMIRMSSSGVYGIFDPSFDTIEAGTTAPQNTSSASSRRQMLQSSTSTEKPIVSPIVCLGFGDAMLWDVSDPSRQHFPVYVKDSLLNTNENFDYTEFRDLAEKIAAPNFTLTTFIYTFSVAGVYTFADNADEFRITVIRVVSQNEVCPTSPYEPYTQSSLVTMGVTRERDLLLAPDWPLIGSLVGALVVLVVGTIFALWLFRRQRWGIVGTALPDYRGLGIRALEDKEFANLASKGSTTKRHQLTAAGDERVQAPPGSSRPLTMRLDIPITEFDADFFCSTIAEESAVDESNVLVLTTTDEGKVIVRFVFTGIDDPDRAADFLIARISAEGDEQSELHSHLNILGFEDGAREVEYDAFTGAGGHEDGQLMNIAEMEDEFWDYERQIDLEGFNIRTLYSRLEDQTIHVVAQLAHQRDDLMLLCDKILVESEALKDMFLRIKVDIDDKNQQVKRINDIREEKIVSGQVEYDLPEDVKQVLGQFLEAFFDKNLPSIIQNSNFQTTNVENRTINVQHTVEEEVVGQDAAESPDQVAKVIKREGRLLKSAGSARTKAVSINANDIDGFKDMFSETIRVEKKADKTASKPKRRAADQALTPEELADKVARVKKMTKDLPRDIQDDSDCDEEERAERADTRVAALAQRAQRYRRAIDRITMPSGLSLTTPVDGVVTADEVKEIGEKRRQWQEKRRAERLAADAIPEELQDSADLPAAERTRRRIERERVLAKRVARMEDVLRYFEIPENLEDNPNASPEERQEVRVKRERFVSQKLEKARRIRAELNVPLELEDDSEEDVEERTRRQDAREEIVGGILISNPYVPQLPDPQTADSEGHKENRWQALDHANLSKIAAAQEAITTRDLGANLSDHSDLDDAERTRRRKVREGAGKTLTKKAKAAKHQPVCPAVQYEDTFAVAGPAGTTSKYAEYEDDSDLEDNDRANRRKLRDAYKAGKASALPTGTTPAELLDDAEKGISAPESAQRRAINEAFIKGQNERDTAALIKASAAKAQEVAKEAAEIVEGSDADAQKCYEEGKKAEKDLMSPEFAGSDIERRKLAAAFRVGRLAQRLVAVPEEMDEERHNVTEDRKKVMRVRAEAFLEGAEASSDAIPEAFQDKPNMSEAERVAVEKKRELYIMGKASAIGPLLASEIEAMEKIDKTEGRAMRAAMEAGIASAKRGITEIPAELRDDAPLLGEAEAARRRHLQAIYLQALKAHQADKVIAELMEDQASSPAERKAAKEAFEAGRASSKPTARKVRAETEVEGEEDPEVEAAFIRGLHQGRAAALMRQDVLAANPSADITAIKKAIANGSAAQKQADSMPTELTDDISLTAQERLARATRRDAYVIGRKSRQAQAIPVEQLEEESGKDQATPTKDRDAAAKRQGKVVTAEEGEATADAAVSQEEADKMKKHKQQLLKSAREKQKVESAALAEEMERRAGDEVEATILLLEKEFRHEQRELQIKHGVALAQCPADQPEMIEQLKASQAAELRALLQSQENTITTLRNIVAENAQDIKTKMEEVIAGKHLNAARIEASLAEQRAKAARKMDPIYLAKKPSEIDNTEDLMTYKKNLEMDLQIKERLQKAKETKEKALLEEQLLQVEKLENDNLESRVSKIKAQVVARAQALHQNSAPEELQEELKRIDRTFAQEVESQKAALQNRLAADRMAKRKELSERHAEVRATEMKESQQAVEELIEARKRLKANVKSEQELTDDQKQAVEMMIAQQKVKEEMAEQRRAAVEAAEDKETKAKEDAKLKSEVAREIMRRERESGEKLTDEQRREILDECRRNAAKLDAASTDEQQRQAEALKRRLELRQKKERESTRKSLADMNAETKRQLEEQQRKVSVLSEKLSIKPIESQDDEESAEKAKLEAELKEKKAALQSKHEEQKLQLERQLEEELKKHQDKEAAKMAADAERRKQAMDEDFKKQAAQDMTDEQREELLKKHAADADKLESQLAGDAAAQHAKLQARLEAHRKKKRGELVDKQRDQAQEQDDSMDDALGAVSREAAKHKEQRSIDEAIKRGLNPQQAAEAVMSERHQKELQHVMERHAHRRQGFTEETAQHQELLEETKADLAKATEAEINAIPEDHPDRERKVEELKKKLRKSIDKLAEENTERSEAKGDAMEMLIAEELLALKMRQMNEVFQAAGVKNSEASIARYQAKLAGGNTDGMPEDEELAAFRKQCDEQNAAAQEKLRKEKEALDASMQAEIAELKRKQDEDLKKKEESMKEELRLESQRLQEKLNATRRAAMESASDNVTPATAENMKELTERIFADYVQDAARREEDSKLERDRQNTALENAIQAKRERRKQAGAPTGSASPVSPSTKPPKAEAVGTQVRQLAQLLQAMPESPKGSATSSSTTNQQNVNNVTNVSNYIVNQAQPMQAQQPQQMQQQAGLGGQQMAINMPAPGSAEYQQWIFGLVNQLQASPIMEKLIKIERLVEENQAHNGLLSYYLDEKDRAISANEGKLETVEVSKLPTAQYVVFGFASWIMENIQRMGIGLPDIKIAVASSLPNSQASAIAFRNSYFYDASRKTLFIRDTRLNTIGEFTVVMIHALAHIKAASAPDRGDIITWNDSDPAFLTQFYGLLEVCTEEMFFMRLPKELAYRDEAITGRSTFRPQAIMSTKSLSAIATSLKGAGETADGRQAMLKNSLMLD